MLRGGAPEQLFSDKLKVLVDHSQAILDVGTSQRFAKELKSYESWFAGKRYVAAGYLPSREFGAYSCDAHQDIQRMEYPDESFDGVICIEVLEHVADPFRAARELARVLRKGGHLLLTVPFNTGFHGKSGRSAAHTEFPDYWRFTHQGLALMFSAFEHLEVHALDGPIECRLKLLRLQKFIDLPPVRSLLDRVDPRRPGKITSRHLLFGTK